jgi:phospholipase/carboxylesterase
MDPSGWTTMTDAGEPSTLLYLPPDAAGEGAARLVVLFHGAGQFPRSVAPLLESQAREHRLALLLPKSTAATWDAISSRPGPDLRRLDALIAAVAGRVAFDEERVVAAGFSDGASYALGTGIATGDHVSEIIAFSPGFVAAVGEPLGQPRIFVAHGRQDTVLPIDRTSRRVVPSLRRAGYDVEFQEFDGGHSVPPEVAAAAVRWLLAPRA